MIVCKCEQKFRDKNNIIIGYRLVDNKGARQDIEAKPLKKMIERGEIEVTNLSLTSDGRLISVEKNDKFDLKVFRQKFQFDRIYKRYQSIFDAIGVDVLAAVYMTIPQEHDTMDSVICKTFDNFGGSNLPSTVAELLAHPEAIIGLFSSTRYEESHNVRRTDGKFALTGMDSITRIPLLLLHKDGHYKVVMCSEIEYEMNAAVSFQESIRNKNDCDIKRNVAIITVNKELNAEILDVGKKISNKEQLELANRILHSELAYWANEATAKKMIQKVDRKEMASRLKSYGVTSLAVPFVAVIAVGVAGSALVRVLFEFVMGACMAEQSAYHAEMDTRRNG